MVSTQIRAFPVLVPAKRTVPIQISGSFLKVLESSSESDMIFSFDHGTATEIPVGVGLPSLKFDNETQTLIPAVFESIQIQNPTDQDETITISVSLGEPSDSRSFIQGEVQVDLSSPVIETADPISIALGETKIAAADARIKERILQNNGASPVWFGDATVDAATFRGTRINPGGVMMINHRGAVHMKTQDGASVVSINNIIKV